MTVRGSASLPAPLGSPGPVAATCRRSVRPDRRHGISSVPCRHHHLHGQEARRCPGPAHCGSRTRCWCASRCARGTRWPGPAFQELDWVHADLPKCSACEAKYGSSRCRRGSDAEGGGWPSLTSERRSTLSSGAGGGGHEVSKAVCRPSPTAPDSSQATNVPGTGPADITAGCHHETYPRCRARRDRQSRHLGRRLLPHRRPARPAHLRPSRLARRRSLS